MEGSRLVAAAFLAVLFSANPTAAGAQPPPSPPPVLVSPPDDPDQDHCFAPDRRQGIKLDWKRAEPPLGSYIEIRRGDPDTGTWRPWVKTYANPPFTLNVRTSVYDAVFAWRVWTVDRSGTARPYASASAWWMFCTAPEPGR